VVPAARLLLPLSAWSELLLAFGVLSAGFFGLLLGLLYRGRRVARDLTLGAWPSYDAESFPSGMGDWLAFFEGPALAAVLVIVSFAGVFVVLEALLPFIVATASALCTGLLRRALHARADCAGRLGRSLAWAGAWTTLYAMPVLALFGLARL
jgi:hypothetical protein